MAKTRRSESGRGLIVSLCGKMGGGCLLDPGHDGECEGWDGPRVVEKRNESYRRLGRFIAEYWDKIAMDVLTGDG